MVMYEYVLFPLSVPTNLVQKPPFLGYFREFPGSTRYVLPIQQMAHLFLTDFNAKFTTLATRYQFLYFSISRPKNMTKYSIFKAMTYPKSHHVAASNLPERFFGASPPPCGVSDVIQNHRHSFRLNSRFSSSSLYFSRLF